jgi:hypothetical protein
MTNYKTYDSRVIYEMEGHLRTNLNTDNFTRATEASVTNEADLKYDELLHANIINLDSWLMPSWAERLSEKIELENGVFYPDFNNTTVRLDLRSNELVEAAQQRADEDCTEAAYILGSWVYLAEKRDHIPSAYTIQTAFERVSGWPNQPDDATTEEYRGGQDE